MSKSNKMIVIQNQNYQHRNNVKKKFHKKEQKKLNQKNQEVKVNNK